MAGPRPLRSTDPRRIGAYELLARLGEGGQGTVFLARGGDGVQVALKLLRAEVVDDPRARRFLEREMTAVARVAAFCTARIIAFHADGDAPHLVSEYVDGPSLQEHVLETTPFAGNALTTLAIGTATALAAIHEAGVVHRDFKPANVLLGPDGPRVIDFGVARPLDATTATLSQAVGTPAYMSPEQLAGDRAGPPMDLFAWACTIVFAATGRAAFPGSTAPSVINRILTGDPDPAALSTLPALLHDLATACLAKDPTTRPTATDLLKALLNAPTPGALLAQGAATAATLTRTPGPHTLDVSAAALPDSYPPAPRFPQDDVPTDLLSSKGAVGARPPYGEAPSAERPYGWTAPAQPYLPAQPGPVGTVPTQPPYGQTPGGAWGAPPAYGPGLPVGPPTGGGRDGSQTRRTLVIAASAVGVVLAAGAVTGVVLLNGNGQGAKGSGSSGSISPTAAAAGTCHYLPPNGVGNVKQTGTPPATPALSGKTTATISTSQGTITVRLDATTAPCAVNSFAYLARSGYYDNTACHRLTLASTGLGVLQCGDPSGTGAGGPSYRFGNENVAAARYTRGTVAMANTGTDGTNGSQFFLLYADAPSLPKDYTVFGQVTSGMDVVDKVAAKGTDNTNGTGDGRPKLPISLLKVGV